MKPPRMTLLSLFGLALIAASAAEPDSCRRAPADEPEHARLEAEVVKRVNDYRAKKGRPELEIDLRLTEQARRHSLAMASGDVPFSHEGFDDRIAASGVHFQAAAENVGENQGFSDPAAQAVKGWLQSKGHHANILGNYNLTGVGVAKSPAGVYFFTQIFILQEKSAGTSGVGVRFKPGDCHPEDQIGENPWKPAGKRQENEQYPEPERTQPEERG